MSVLRIAEVAPPLERVPPLSYGGTERVIFELVRELHRRGHVVTTFASGDSEPPGRHVATVPRALRPAGISDDPGPWMLATAGAVLEAARRGEFDLLHCHLEGLGDLMAASSPVPVVTTYHNRIDHPALGPVLAASSAHHVAVSAHQASTRPEVRWAEVIYNGLTLREGPAMPVREGALAFVGRVAPEKGILEAMEIARRVDRPLRIAAKIGTQPREAAYHREVFLPALERARADVEFLGELDEAERDALLARSYATLMPGAWPEPFGLVAIESLAAGTPVLARRVGALPEIIREGQDGFFGDDVQHLASLVDRVAELDRDEIRVSVLERFNAEQMADRYEALFLRIAGTTARGRSGSRRRTSPARAAGRPHGRTQRARVAGAPDARGATAAAGAEPALGATRAPAAT